MKHLIIIVALAASAAGCLSEIRDDNTMVGKVISEFEGEPVVPRNANRLYIAQPADTTGTDEIARKLYNKLRENISLDGRLGVDTDDALSDLKLEIRITRYLIERTQYDEIGRAVKKRMWITADARLMNVRRRKMIFYEADIQSFREYSELTAPIENEARVQEYVLDDLAKRISAKTVTGWYTEQMTTIEKRKP
jgi:hypothetical protein